MHVSRLELVDFRSYATARLDLGTGPTLFLGPNGQGKTNLVEAVGFLSTLGSHRVGTDAPLVRAGAERAVVRARVDREGREVLVELEITPGRANRARVNASPVRRTAEVLGILRTVLFAPEDLDLVKGDPGGRRAFLDSFLVACAPRWAAVRTDYDRIVRQRTALLRSAGGRGRGGATTGGGGPGGAGGGAVASLDSWDDHLARIGAQLVAGRVWAVGLLGPRLREAYAALAGTPLAAVPDGALDPRGAGAVLRCSALETAGIDTTPFADGAVDADAVHSGTDPEILAAAERGLRLELERRRGDELDRGQCLVGPHRDDLHLTVGALPARGYASHGESWSVALALRLATFEVLRRRIEEGGDPVLLLDDVFAELDDRRRERLADLVADAEQVLVTAAVVDDVPRVLRAGAERAGGASGDGSGTGGGRAARFQVRTGEVTRAA